MRQTFVFLSVVSAVAWSVGCAETGVCPPAHRLIDGACTPPAAPCPEEVTRAIPTGCVLDPRIISVLSGEPVSFFSWELTVEPERIPSGTRFAVGFRGRVLVGEDSFNIGLITLGAFHRVAVTNVEARVQVREGAEGADVVLRSVPTYSCTYDGDGFGDPQSRGPFPPCAPERDNPDGSNDDCIVDGQTDPANRCLAYYEVPTSDDCSEDGMCAQLGQVGDGLGCDTACECVGFCAVRDVEIALEAPPVVFTAEAAGSVLFGWAEQGVGVVQSGPNRGAFELEQIRRTYGQPIRYSGIDALVRGISVAFECITGEHSRRSDLATTEIGLGRSRDSALIACPIQEPLSN